MTQEMITAGPDELAERLRRQERADRAYEIAHETINPILERTGEVKRTVGVELIEPYEVRRDTPLPPGLLLLSDHSDGISAELVGEQERVVALTPKGERRIREDAAHIAVGRESAVTLADVGVPHDTQICVEGGLMTGKVETELKVALRQGSGRIVMTLSKHRSLSAPEHTAMADKLNRASLNFGTDVAGSELAQQIFANNGELAYRDHVQRGIENRFETLRYLGAELPPYAGRREGSFRAVGSRDIKTLLDFLEVNPADLKTEYDAGVVEVVRHPDFVAYSEPVIIGHVPVGGETNGEGMRGSLVAIGTISGREIYIQDVPREDLFDGDKPVLNAQGKQKYIQPNAAQLLTATANLLDSKSAVVLTSNTYFPSRLADVVEAQFDAIMQAEDLESARRLSVITYSPRDLAEVQGKPEPELLSIAHILGEVQWADKKFTQVSKNLEKKKLTAAA